MDIFRDGEMVTAVTCEYCEQSNYIVIIGCGIVLLWGVALLYICFIYGGQVGER